MVKPIRRVVTGHDENGKAVVITDGPAANVVTAGAVGAGKRRQRLAVVLHRQWRANGSI